MGLSPTTSGLASRCSNNLSYICEKISCREHTRALSEACGISISTAGYPVDPLVDLEYAHN